MKIQRKSIMRKKTKRYGIVDQLNTYLDDNDEENEQQQEQIQEEFIFDAVGGLVDEKLLFFAQQAQRRKGKAGRAKNVIFSKDIGRYIKPMLPKGPIKRLAIDATLRAAAPYQKLRRAKDTQKTRKIFVEKTDMRAKRMARKAGSQGPLVTILNATFLCLFDPELSRLEVVIRLAVEFIAC
ncbi:hypothetical protein Syun_019073 [Stephania yunnanensis]|uniref:Uncharacterized protein n=1 Tax=Stephania yunnanensis TaxID=152371 RepID=A0AAP0IVS9_9MAGN